MNTEPFNNRTQFYHSNTRPERYSDGYCTVIPRIAWHQTKCTVIFSTLWSDVFPLVTSSAFPPVTSSIFFGIVEMLIDCLLWLKPIVSETRNLEQENKVTVTIRFTAMSGIQISAKWGTDSIFAIEANTKSLWPKSSGSRIVKLMDRDSNAELRTGWLDSIILG